MRVKGLLKYCLFSWLLITSAASVADQNHDPSITCWKNSIAAYGWIFGQCGTMDLGEVSVDVDVTPGDVLQNLGLIDFILQLHMEACNGKWAFIIDPTFLKITTKSTLTTPLRRPIPPLVTLKITSVTRFSLVDFGVFYTAWSRCFDDSGRWIKFDLLGGGRNFHQDSDIKIEPITTLSNGANWIAAMVGGRCIFHVAGGTNVVIRADGALGCDTHSYSAIATIGYSFHRNFSAIVGYRVLDFCGKDGAGDDRFNVDLLYYGPMAGLMVNW